MGIFPQVKGGKEREEEEKAAAAACVMQREKCLAQSVTFARSIDCPDLGMEAERLINKHAMSVRTARLRRYRRVFVVLEEREARGPPSFLNNRIQILRESGQEMRPRASSEEVSDACYLLNKGFISDRTFRHGTTCRL